MLRQLLLLNLLLFLPFSALCAQQETIVVFAGSASQPPLEEAVQVFQEETGIQVILQLGGSGALLNQIKLTRQGDIYIPGSPDYMELARQLDLIEGESKIIAYLIPAIIVAKGNPLEISSLEDLARPGLRLGIAEPNGVCVGLYAVELLEANNWTDKVRPNLRGMVESCAKAAAMIPLNMVDAVLGWREFAGWNPEMMEAILLTPEELPRLAYIPAAQLRHSKNTSGSEKFISFLQSETGQGIFQKWGYITDEASARKFAPHAKTGGLFSLPGGW